MCRLNLADFQRVSDRTPLLADLKPSGKYVMEDLWQVGGVPAVMKLLLAEGLLHGDCLTVTGKTVAENLAEHARADAGPGDHLPALGAHQEDRPSADHVRQPGD